MPIILTTQALAKSQNPFFKKDEPDFKKETKEVNIDGLINIADKSSFSGKKISSSNLFYLDVDRGIGLDAKHLTEAERMIFIALKHGEISVEEWLKWEAGQREEFMAETMRKLFPIDLNKLASKSWTNLSPEEKAYCFDGVPLEDVYAVKYNELWKGTQEGRRKEKLDNLLISRLAVSKEQLLHLTNQYSQEILSYAKDPLQWFLWEEEQLGMQELQLTESKSVPHSHYSLLSYDGKQFHMHNKFFYQSLKKLGGDISYKFENSITSHVLLGTGTFEQQEVVISGEDEKFIQYCYEGKAERAKQFAPRERSFEGIFKELEKTADKLLKILENQKNEPHNDNKDEIDAQLTDVNKFKETLVNVNTGVTDSSSKLYHLYHLNLGALRNLKDKLSKQRIEGQDLSLCFQTIDEALRKVVYNTTLPHRYFQSTRLKRAVASCLNNLTKQEYNEIKTLSIDEMLSKERNGSIHNPAQAKLLRATLESFLQGESNAVEVIDILRQINRSLEAEKKATGSSLNPLNWFGDRKESRDLYDLYKHLAREFSKRHIELEDKWEQQHKAQLLQEMEGLQKEAKLLSKKPLQQKEIAQKPQLEEVGSSQSSARKQRQVGVSVTESKTRTDEHITESPSPLRMR